MDIMMSCGCSGIATHHGEHDGLEKSHPTCIVHGTCTVAEKPNLEGRTAKCTYFGKHKPNRRFANDECNYGCRGQENCRCGSVASSLSLAFFAHNPDEAQDTFYCGCMGWD